MPQVRLTIRMLPAAVAGLDRAAQRHSLSRSDLIVRALGVLLALEDCTDRGLYVGATDERERLNEVIVAPPGRPANDD